MNNIDNHLFDCLLIFFILIKKIYVLLGIPGAGKSTWVKKTGVKFTSRDIIREKLGYCGAGEKMAGTKEQEAKVTELQDEEIKKLLEEKEEFAVDDTNLHPKFRKELINKLKSHGDIVVGVRINTPFSCCVNRRKGQIPLDIMKVFAKRLSEIDPSEFDCFIEEKGC